MSQKNVKLFNKVVRGQADKKQIKRFYNNLNVNQKTKFNTSLKLFIKTKNESTVQKS